MPNSTEHVPAEVLAATVVAQPKPKAPAKPKAKVAKKVKAEPEKEPAPSHGPGVYWNGERYVSDGEV